MREWGSRTAGACRSDGAALLPRHRRAAAATAGGALAVLVALGVVVGGGTGPTGFDTAVRDRLSGWLPLDVARAFADLGSPAVIVAVVVVGAAGFAARRRLRAALLVVLAPVVAIGLVEEVGKPIFGRTLTVDGGSGLSYPSGHTAAVGAVGFAVIVTALRPARREARRSAAAVVGPGVAIAGSALAVLACAAGLVVAGYHYASDTIGGAALSAATVVLLALAIDATAEAGLRRWRRRVARDAGAPVEVPRR